jgi:hypothetical protein
MTEMMGQRKGKPKRPLFSKPAGCFVQLVGAAVILWGLNKLMEKPTDIMGTILPIVIGGGILLLGRKTI